MTRINAIGAAADYRRRIMGFRTQVSRTLDDEHRASLDLLGRVESALARAAPGGETLGRVAESLGRLAAEDIGRHFDFEERELFPRMDAAGDGEMAALLREEHDAIREVCAELEPLLRAARDGPIDDARAEALERLAIELCEREVAHIQKESMALLPLLDDLLDDEADRELAFAYASA